MLKKEIVKTPSKFKVGDEVVYYFFDEIHIGRVSKILDNNNVEIKRENLDFWTAIPINRIIGLSKNQTILNRLK